MHSYEFHFRDIVDAAKDIIVVTKVSVDEPGPEIVYVNDAFTRLTEYTKEEAIGQSPRMLQGDETDVETKKEIREALLNKSPVRKIIKNFSKSGRAYWLDISIHPLKNSEGEVTHFVAIERDITAMKEHQLSLEEMIRTDPLTGLLNRRAYNELCEKELSRSRRTGSPFAMLMVDIDNFKNVNDSYGHSAGDRVLEQLARIAMKHFRLQDSVSRIGGEEFCILLPETDTTAAYKTAERFRRAIEESYVSIGEKSIKITISIGVSEILKSDTEIEVLAKRADDALYKAKESGRNRVCEG